jgi:predicted GIY-YIG superfamily endonuclease
MRQVDRTKRGTKLFLKIAFAPRTLRKSKRRMAQLLLFSDPRPLVERLGAEFFRRAPEGPGVYLMRDHCDNVVYVGKAKNLRKRLASYRVANPDRVPRRHLRLLRLVHHIEVRPCANEDLALMTESALLRTLRPGFNRAGTWPAAPRFVAWRSTPAGLELAVRQSPPTGWPSFGPLGSTAVPLRAALVRLIWYALFPQNGPAGLPGGWFAGRFSESCAILGKHQAEACLHGSECLQRLFTGNSEPLVEWVLSKTVAWVHRFELAARDADLQTVMDFVERGFGPHQQRGKNQAASLMNLRT